MAKHSSAKAVQVSLGKSEGRIELFIQDDGIGFDPERRFEPGSGRQGLGLTSMRERAALSGGGFSISSDKGKGTVLRAIWPVG